jgi:SH3 domain-containing YSC84-like protein 1
MKYAVRVLLILALVAAVPLFAEDRGDVMHRLDEATNELNQLTNAPDKGIPQEVMESAKCVAIVPSLVKGGFIFGARFGRGVATCRVNGAWSAPAFFTIAGGSWGAQIGVEGVDLVMLFMDEQGAQHLLSANWKIGADANIAAGPWGRRAAASAPLTMRGGILTYSRARGVFIGASLNGANVHADGDAIRLFYGRRYHFRSLLEGQVRPPRASQHFLAEVHRDFREAEASK